MDIHPIFHVSLMEPVHNDPLLSRLEFPLLLTFLISLPCYPLSLLICMAMRVMHYDIVGGFVGSCAAALVMMFRLIC
jgi:hypothetical protein